MASTNEPRTVRRRPRQMRSRERVDRILDAAGELLAEGGYEALTMKALAQRADVAIGTLYQFFAGKHEVVGALGERYLDVVQAVVDELAGRRFRSWERALDAVFDAYVAFYRSDPAFRALWVEQHLDSSLRDADAALNARIAAGARRIVEPLLPGPLPQPELNFLVVIEVGDHLLDLAFRLDPGGHAPTIDMARRMLRVHLADQVGGRRRR